MQLKDYINAGALKAEGLTTLGKMLGLSQPAISAAKAQTRPLPIDAVVKLSDYIGADLKAVIAANELVTEKKAEKRSFWLPFVETARAAVAVLTIASVVNFTSPTPAQAAPAIEAERGEFVLCKAHKILSSKKQELFGRLKKLVESVKSFFASRIPKPQPI